MHLDTIPSGSCTARKRSLKQTIQARMPKSLLLAYRFFRTGDVFSVITFLVGRNPRVSLMQRLKLVLQLYRISYHVRCEHSQTEIIRFIRAILSIPSNQDGCVIEAGSFKGGSTAKFSLAARLANRELLVFDSFEGIPENSEPHDKNIFGGRVGFFRGDYCGTLEEVKANVSRFGDIGVCRFVKGFFKDTMPHFDRPVAVAYLDVDLASSTRTCLKHLWPLLIPGGVIFSQDGHLPLVLDVFEDDRFWSGEVGVPKPTPMNVGTNKLIWVQK